MESKNWIEHAAQNKQRREDKKTRTDDLRRERTEINEQINQTRVASPEATALEEAWKGTVDYWKQELVSSLKNRAGNGKLAQINLASPEFLAFALADVLKEKIPELAQAVVGTGGVTDREKQALLARLNTRLVEINTELGGLGIA